jgi:GT2 family glycosyltransferase
MVLRPVTPALRFSIIVATKNRSKELSALLIPTLLSQTCPPDQIVFVDQSSDDSTRKVVEAFANGVAGKSGPRPQFLYVHETSHIGAASARNSGIERSEGDILVFLDDDVSLEPNFLQELLAVYQQHPDVGGVAGVITNYPHPSLLRRIVRRLFWTGPFHDERQPIYWSADRLRNHKPIRVRKFGSGVMSVKRLVLNGDRFDNRYRGAGAEDIDLSWRLSERHPLVITPRARLVHARTETGRPHEHWLAYDGFCDHYLYLRIWNFGVVNRICFAWLNFGYALLATLGSLRRASLEPWHALVRGIRRGREQAGSIR